MKFQQIRSATAIVSFGGVRFLIDPWLAKKDSFPPIPGSQNPELRCPIHELPISIEKILAVDAVIATHLHFDHFDEVAIKSIPKNMIIFVQDEVDAKTLRDYGFGDIRVLQHAGTIFNGVWLYKTDCRHGIPGKVEVLYEMMKFRGDACGVVFKHPAESKTFYLAGDTIFCDYVEKAIEQFQPDIIVVNAAEATINGFGRIIMGIADIKDVMNFAPNASLIVSHMDEVGHSVLWRSDICEFANQNSLQNRILVPDDGEICDFGS